MTPASCPACGSPLSPGAARGLCPRCLLAGVAGPTEATLPRPAPPSLAEVAAAFPQFEIVSLIGQGGMGAVYQVRQPKLDRFAALKLLPETLAADPAFAVRFEREARLLAKLSHPGVVSVYDYGQEGGYFFLLMEFVDGVNLRQAMRAGRFSAPQALALVPRICEALQYAHDEGVLHRDIKPENILLDAKGRVKLADFGIAKLMGKSDTGVPPEHESPMGGTPLPPPAPGLTQAGAALGTPAYMAPEQRDTPSTVDHRADIYSLGVVFYELLTGELPTGAVVSPSAKCAADPRVDAIVRQALERERELRQNSAAEMRTQVETVTSTPAVPPLPRLLKTSGGTLTTPSDLSTLSRQFFYYRNNRGHLVLNERELIFTKGGTATVIPLADITDISIGQFPRSMNPAGIALLSLTHRDGHGTRQILISPMDGVFGWPSTWNARVADWAETLRSACRGATGRTPPSTPKHLLGIPQGGRLAIATILVPVLVPALVFFIFKNGLSSQKDFGPHQLLLLIPLLLPALVPILMILWSTRRSALEERSSIHPPSPGPAMAPQNPSPQRPATSALGTPSLVALIPGFVGLVLLAAGVIGLPEGVILAFSLLPSFIAGCMSWQTAKGRLAASLSGLLLLASAMVFPFLWLKSRANPTAHGAQFSFGPEFSVPIPAPAPGTPSVLDFETARLHIPPDDVARELAAGVVKLSETTRSWIESTGVDAVLNPGQNQLRLFGGTAFHQTDPVVEYDRWEPNAVVASVNSTLAGDKISWGDPSGAFHTSTEHQAPKAVLFSTRDGGRGVLTQEALKGPPGRWLQLRYKMAMTTVVEQNSSSAQSVRPVDIAQQLTEAKTDLAQRSLRYGPKHPELQKALLRVKILEELWEKYPHMSQELREAKVDLAQRSLQYGPKHPKMIEAQNLIATLEKAEASEAYGAPTANFVQYRSKLLIRKYLQNINTTETTLGDETIFSQNLRDYQVHNGSKTGTTAAQTTRENGPASDGFRLTILRLKAPLVSQAALPQFFDRPYWKSYANTSFDANTGEGVAVYFDYGNGLPPAFLESMLGLLTLEGSL